MANLILRNKRCFFPTLDTPQKNEKFPEAPAMYSIIVRIEPGSDDDKRIWNAINEVGAAEKKAQWPKYVERIKLARNQFPYHDGDEYVDAEGNVRAGYEGGWVLKANIAATRGKPLVLDNVPRRDEQGALVRDSESGKLLPALAAPGRVYSGCYVDLSCDFFYSKKSQGIACSLLTVRFASDGEAFGGSKPTVKGFELDDSEVGDGFDQEQDF